jgi:hypothetical protein
MYSACHISNWEGDCVTQQLCLHVNLDSQILVRHGAAIQRYGIKSTPFPEEAVSGHEGGLGRDIQPLIIRGRVRLKLGHGGS